MQTKWDFASSTDMCSTSAGGHLTEVINLTGFTVFDLLLTTVQQFLQEAISYCQE
jgi:hypothetical protein